MATDASVIEAVEQAVEADPDNLALRLHLAGLLDEVGRAVEALAQAQAVLERSPAETEALRLASRTALATGDTERATAYERLLRALTGDHPLDAGADEVPAAPQADGESESNVVSLRVVDGGADEAFDVEQPTVTLADVGGMEPVKRRLEVAFLAPLRNPELRSYYGKSLRGGLLLYGPPGCGKTFIARALAGELGVRFQAVGLSDILDMYLGESERKLHEVFQTARRHSPCVLFLDELDALGQKRSQMRHSAGRTVVNQLLAELDGAGESNDGVFVLAATNHPWDVDTALRRPGRLDRTVLVLPPDEPAREAILAVHLRDRPVEGVDIPRVAARTSGFSGADLAYLCESAAELAMEDSITSGQTRAIGQRDLERAAKALPPSTNAWFQVAYNYAMFANEGGAYDELLDYIREQKLT